MLTALHVSVTEKQMKQIAREEALAMVEELHPETEEEKTMARTMIKTAPTYKMMCDALTSIRTENVLPLYEKFLERTLSRLDPHTAFQSPQTFKKRRDAMNGTNFKGLGIEFKSLGKEGHGPFQVENIAPDSDTLPRGLQVDDVIMKINDKMCSDLSTSEFGETIKNHSGSLSFTLQRGDQSLEITGILKKELFFPRVKAHFIHSSGLIYLKILSFSEQLELEVRQALSRLGGLKHRGILLDLRGNGGGDLRAAVALADLFIDEGSVTLTQNRLGMIFPYAAGTPGELESCPLVILINENSASASELFTAALQDHGRAVVVGRPSYGKGSVQNLWELRSVSPYEGYIWYTSNFYYRPTGLPLQLRGVTPDIEIKNPKFEEFYEKFRREYPEGILYEKDYKNVLPAKPLQTLQRTFQPTYEFREISLQRLASVQMRQTFSELEQHDMELTRAADILKILTHQPIEPNYFGNATLYPSPYHRLHITCDLWTPERAKDHTFLVEFHFRDPSSGKELYKTAGFMVGKELTLSLEKTPLQNAMEEEEHGSFLLDMTVYQKTKATGEVQIYPHSTVVPF